MAHKVVADDTMLEVGEDVTEIDHSETTSIASSIYKGYAVNGWRYQAVREEEYWEPSEEKQFEPQLGAHILNLIVDSRKANPLFRAPVPDIAKNILNIGTAIYLAGLEMSRIGIPQQWFTAWTFIRHLDSLVPTNYKSEGTTGLHSSSGMYGAFTSGKGGTIYKQAYDYLVPGGWVEQQEPNINFRCDDGTMPADFLEAQWWPTFITTKPSIEAAGFANVLEATMKVPFGDLAENPLMKEAGAFNKKQLVDAMEGYVMLILTRMRLPGPWTPEEVRAYLSRVSEKMNKGWHVYLVWKQGWADWPMDAEA